MTSIRSARSCTLGLATVLVVGSISTARAQGTDTTGRARPQTHIPVRKDQPQTQAAPPRIDTVTVTRTDTVVLRRTDTLIVTRTDTVTRLAQPTLQRLPGLVAGIGAGIAVPTRCWRNTTTNGPALHAHLGYFPGASALGVRADVDYDMFSRREPGCPNCPKPKLISGSGDLVLRFPLDRTSSLNPVFYLLGGGGIDKFTDFLPYGNKDQHIVTAGSDTYLGDPRFVPPLTTAQAGDKSLFYHWDAGPGLEFSFGPAHLFVEGKYTTIMTNNGHSRYWPIVAGLNFY